MSVRTPWLNPLSSRLSNLPMVIAGPILRRVDANSVSVMIVTREIGSVTLNIYANSAVVSTNPTPLMTSGLVNPSALGTSLFVYFLTATGATLSQGLIYKYNIKFGTGNVDLNSPGILNALNSSTGGLSMLLYSSGPSHPSFSLPPSNMNNLRILHGSCRKPHGEGEDALEIVDHMITSTVNDPLQRPHQFFMTGDQIYADDVADALLYMIIDASSTLMNWTESLPDILPTTDLNPVYPLKP